MADGGPEGGGVAANHCAVEHRPGPDGDESGPRAMTVIGPARHDDGHDQHPRAACSLLADVRDMVGVADRHRPMGGGDVRGPAVTGGAEACHVQQSSEERAAATVLLR
ncbi:hypothetical protein [Streptomyces mirabilis]|uniref:hypothetical protein n=1 Tax=Streptomyces mirabilis TaxID=68239 RepID=UPI00381DA7C9